jgi:TRAP-type C4-dicarboxylate transport system permease small subunit
MDNAHNCDSYTVVIKLWICILFIIIIIIIISVSVVVLTTVGDPPRWPRDTPLSTKVGTKFRRQVAVAQSV